MLFDNLILSSWNLLPVEKYIKFYHYYLFIVDDYSHTFFFFFNYIQKDYTLCQCCCIITIANNLCHLLFQLVWWSKMAVDLFLMIIIQ